MTGHWTTPRALDGRKVFVIDCFDWFPNASEIYSNDRTDRKTLIAIIGGNYKCYDDMAFISVRVSR